MGIAHDHSDRGMPKDALQAENIPARHHVVTGKGVPQDMG